MLAYFLFGEEGYYRACGALIAVSLTRAMLDKRPAAGMYEESYTVHGAARVLCMIAIVLALVLALYPELMMPLLTWADRR